MNKGVFSRLRKRRGFRVWMYLLGMSVFSAAGWLRLFDSLQDWYWLEQVAKVAPGPLYLAITGAVWGVAALIGIVWVFLQLRLWRSIGMVAALFLALTYWADRLLMTRSEDGYFNAGFAALFTIVGLLAALFALRPWEEGKTHGIERSGS